MENITASEPSGQAFRPHPSYLKPSLRTNSRTPLMIGGVIYVCTPLSVGAAIDAATGETLWVYNPKSYEVGTPTLNGIWSHRGVAYWTDGERERILWGTGDYQLICVDAVPNQGSAQA